jgi:hypothetical protein
LVLLGQNISVDERTFSISQVTDGIIHFVLSTGGGFNSVTDANGGITVTVPQTSGPAKVYDVTIDDQGLVTLTLQAPAGIPVLDASGQTLIGIRLSSEVDKPYVIIYRDKEYTSDSNGYVTLDSGAKLRWSKQFLNDETLEIITPAGVSSGMIHYHFDGTAWQMTGAESRSIAPSGIVRQSSSLDFSRQVIEGVSRDDFGQVWQREYFIFQRAIDVRQFLTLDLERGWLRIEGMDDYRNGALFSYIRYSVFGNIFRFQDETLGWCRLFAVNGQDVTEAQVIGLSHRTGTELRSLIVNDNIVQE